MINKIGFRGYVSSSPIDGSVIPQSLQNLKIRDYAKSKNITFKLSITEYNFKKKYFALNSLKKQINTFEGIIFFSIYQLPINKKIIIIFLKFFLTKNKHLYFALEDIVLKKIKDIEDIEIIYFISENSKKNYKLKI